jgi:hypothetical protein
MSKVSLAGNASGTGIFTIASPNSNTDRTINLPDATGTVQVSGNPISGTTGTFSGIIQANGGGIQFPATQVPSADANTLDDYEEGTWTPTITGSTTNPTVSYGVAFGYYTKIGDTVTAYINITTSSVSGGSGAVQLSLPFAVTTANQFLGQGSIEIKSVTLNAGYTYAGFLAVFNTGAKVFVRQYGSNQPEIDIPCTSIGGAPTLRCTVIYKV